MPAEQGFTSLLTWQHVVEAGLGLRMAQQRFGSKNDELEERESMLGDLNHLQRRATLSLRCCTHRLPEGLQDLSAQDVEVVRRSRAVHDDPVTVVQLAHGEVLRQFLTKRTELVFVCGGESCSELWK